MIQNEAQVALTVNFRGAQTTRGRYGYFNSRTKTGIEEGLTIERSPKFAEVSKQMLLKEAFVEGALQEPPKGMKMLPTVWRSIPEKKRISIHVERLVHELYPNKTSYSYEII